jgi:iron(III) transport system substrate-binding protein
MSLDRRDFSILTGAAALAPWTVARAQSTLAALHQAAKKEGQLTWYTAFVSSEDAEMISRAFTARYPGVKVNVVRTTAQVAFQRLNQDLRARSANCDVFSSTDIAHYVDLKKRKLLTRYVPAASVMMDKRLQNLDPDGYFHVANVAMIGLIYNTNKVKPEDAPTSWAALTDAKWRGLVSVGHPGFSGYVGVWAIEMRKLYGDGWFKQLAANEPQVGRSIIDTVTTVTSGERSTCGSLAASCLNQPSP